MEDFGGKVYDLRGWGQDIMEVKEIHRNLFTVGNEYYLAHCISSDCKMGAGIAVEFNRRFNLRSALLRYSEDVRKHPTCILEGRVFNLITKEKYWNKPTYDTIENSLAVMRDIVRKLNIKYIAIPKIGSGLDRLEWNKVKKIIIEVFKDIDVEILVCKI